jgi:hypothetical protein
VRGVFKPGSKKITGSKDGITIGREPSREIRGRMARSKLSRIVHENDFQNL